MKTYSTRPSHVEFQWHVYDATGRTLGRLATELAVLLQGKHKPMYARHILTGDYVVVINASKIRVTGAKLQQKRYYRHSEYPGGLKETTLAELQKKFPNRVIRAAVRGMLPKTTLGRHMLQRLKVYAGDSHPHESQIRALGTEEAQALLEEALAKKPRVPKPEVANVEHQLKEEPVEAAAAVEAQTEVQDEPKAEEVSAPQAEAAEVDQPTETPAEGTSDEQVRE
jgi:large subunit ribosomal protein L13